MHVFLLGLHVDVSETNLKVGAAIDFKQLCDRCKINNRPYIRHARTFHSGLSNESGHSFMLQVYA